LTALPQGRAVLADAVAALGFFFFLEEEDVVAKGRLAAVLNVQEPVLVLLLFVDGAHEGGVGGDGVAAEQKQGLFRRQLDPLADDVVELPHRQVGGHQVLLLVNVGNVGPVGLLANDRDAVGVLGPDPLGLGLALVLIIIIIIMKRERKGVRVGYTID
jgi:hypothetical protein